mmetsp:Transcript_36912/g.59716  ORF Transcript_36912/g.59716 Transcript_36912/m.59716 type:complete len:105 (-) Transcript_36912:1047-1361(-)
MLDWYSHWCAEKKATIKSRQSGQLRRRATKTLLDHLMCSALKSVHHRLHLDLKAFCVEITGGSSAHSLDRLSSMVREHRRNTLWKLETLCAIAELCIAGLLDDP